MSQQTAAWRCALVAAATLAAPAFAARFEARLVTASGAPALGYRLSVVGSSLSVPVDREGRFVLDPAPAAPFLLVASGPHGELSAPLEIVEVGTGPVELRLPAIVRDSVTVVSGVAPGLDLLPAGAATVVSAEAIEQRPPQRLVDALEAVAGASKLGEGADSVPALRGLARGRTLILVDGARVTAERRAGPSATFVDPGNLESVEVVRGPASVVYGSDAFGGVINAVTRDPAEERTLRATLEVVAGGQNQIGASIAGSTPLGAGALRLSAHAVDAGDAESGGGGKIFNSGFAAKGVALTWARPLGSGRLRAALAVDRVEDLGKAAIDSRSIRAYYPREESERLVVSWIGAPAGSWDSLESTLFIGHYGIVLDRDRAAGGTSNRRIDRSDVEARDASLRSVVGRKFAGGRLQLGADLSSRFDLSAEVGRVSFAGDASTVVAETTTTAIEDARQLTSALFATWSRELSARWSLGAGLRGDRVATRNRGGFFGDRSESASALSGNLAITWAPAPGWSATGQVARGFRVPTLSDRYFRGPSGRGFVVGAPELAPERGLQWDLAVRRTFGGTAIALYGYRYEFEELIERFRAGDDFHFRNRGEARLEGLEIELQSRIDEGWILEAGGAWVRGRADGAPIDDQPAPNLFVGARWAGESGYGFVRLALRDEKSDPGPNELERAGYGLLDLGGGWRLTERLELRASLRNALDRNYFGSADDAADRSPGRSLLLALTIQR